MCLVCHFKRIFADTVRFYGDTAGDDMVCSEIGWGEDEDDVIIVVVRISAGKGTPEI